jgi:LuxR family maltose regulon positive regulatory protein
LAWVKQAQGQEAAATAAMQRALQLARAYNLPRTVQETQAWQAQLWLWQHQLEPAQKWAEAYHRLPPTESAHELEDIMLARVWLTAGQTADALTLLDKLLMSAQTGERHRRVLEIQLLQALAWQQSGNQQFALEALNHALTLAEPEGYSRVFLTEGELLFALLRKAREREANAAFIDRLLAEAGISSQAAVNSPDDLTERELEVLRLMAVGASNQYIAAALVISLGTVKAHTNHILSKLGARNRTEAVAFAQTKGVLDKI